MPQRLARLSFVAMADGWGTLGVANTANSRFSANSAMRLRDRAARVSPVNWVSLPSTDRTVSHGSLHPLL